MCNYRWLTKFLSSTSQVVIILVLLCLLRALCGLLLPLYLSLLLSINYDFPIPIVETIEGPAILEWSGRLA